jgi:hypothetical protein
MQPLLFLDRCNKLLEDLKGIEEKETSLEARGEIQPVIQIMGALLQDLREAQSRLYQRPLFSVIGPQTQRATFSATTAMGSSSSTSQISSMCSSSTQQMPPLEQNSRTTSLVVTTLKRPKDEPNSPNADIVGKHTESFKRVKREEEDKDNCKGRKF